MTDDKALVTDRGGISVARFEGMTREQQVNWISTAFHGQLIYLLTEYARTEYEGGCYGIDQVLRLLTDGCTGYHNMNISQLRGAVSLYLHERSE